MLRMKHDPFCSIAVQLSLLAVIAFGVANRVLYKMALVPMGDYGAAAIQFRCALQCWQLCPAFVLPHQCSRRAVYPVVDAKPDLLPESLGSAVFFLAQFQTFGYCAVYFTALAVRYKCAPPDWHCALHLALLWLPF